MIELKKEIQELKIRESKAERQDDIPLLATLTEQRLLKELELVRYSKKDVKINTGFKPLNHSKIKAISMEKIGLDYIPLIKGAYNVLSGRGGSGKSAVALKSVLLWLRSNQDKTALVFFTEDGIEEIRNRCRTICNNSSLPHNLIDRIFFICLDNDDRIKWITTSKNGYVIKEDYVNSVVQFCLENKTEYIILDPLKRFHRLSENSNDDMDVLVRDVFTRLAVDTNAVVLVLHHSSKGEGGARGASTITDSARIAWQIGRYFKRGEDGKLVENQDKIGKIQLNIIKDNLGLEKYCSIRREDGSIDNPLADSGFKNTVVIEEYKEQKAEVPCIL